MSEDDQSRDGSENGTENDSRNDSGNGSGNGGGQETKENGPSMVEKAVMAISVAFTVVLFAFVISQALTTATGVPPQVSVVGTNSMADGGVEVTVRLSNPSDVGLQSATVAVNCTTPPPEIEFQHIPADDYQIGFVRCPSGTSDPEANISWWIEA